MNWKKKASGAGTLDALNKSLIKNQQLVNINNYKSFFDEKRKKIRYFCSMCEQELTDDSIIYKGIAACTDCLLIWATLRTHLHDNKRCKRKPKVIKMHRCFGCDQHFGAEKMSSCLVICKKCMRSIQEQDEATKDKLVEECLRGISKYLRRRTV